MHLTESLWVRWIHGVYTKGANWLIFNPPIIASWSFKKICSMKDNLSLWMLKDNYCIRDVYMSYFDNHPKATWSKFLWNRASAPKGKFILWMILLSKLKTKDKLFQMKYLQDKCCPLCNTTFETISHIFFHCPFSARCLKEIGIWLAFPNLHVDINRMAKFKWNWWFKKIIISSSCSLCYHIWKTRNEAIWLLKMSTVNNVVKRIKCETRARFYALYLVDLKPLFGLEILFSLLSLLWGFLPIVCTWRVS